MNEQQPYKVCLTYSLLLHLFLLSVLILQLEVAAKMPVLENANEVILAEVLPDPLAKTAPPIKNKKYPAPQPAEPIEHDPIPPKVIPIMKPVPQEKAIIIPDKRLERLKQEALLKKQLLAELKKEKELRMRQQQDMQKALEKEMKDLHAKSLQQQLLQEQKRLTHEHQQRLMGEVNKYKALILQSISQHWLVPLNVNKKLYAELLIRVAPGGLVLDVQLTKSSGDEALDRSARAAVFKASPLPVPAEPDTFEAFRQFVLRVRPESVLTQMSWLN